MNSKSKLSLLLGLPLLLSSSFVTTTALAADRGFALKCYVKLANNEHDIYVLWTDDKSKTPRSMKKDLVGTAIKYKSARVNTSIVKVKECRYAKDSFVNVNAIKLEEQSDKAY